MSEAEEKAVFKVTIDGTIDQVWRELTRTDRPQGAMFNSVMHFDRLEPGGQLRMRTPNGKYTNVVGEFVEVERPVQLAHTLRFTTRDDPEATITFTLREVEGGVEVSLVVENMLPGSKSQKDLMVGGPFIVKNLKAVVETGTPTLGARLLYVLFGLMGFLLPAKTRTENWPLPAEELS